MVPLTMAWMAEIISDNAEQRAFTAAAMNTLQCQYNQKGRLMFPLKLCTDTFMAWIPLVWFQQVHQPFVTPGNRAAAVVAGFNIIVFSTIAFLAHRDKVAKKRANLLPHTSDSPEPTTPSDEVNSKGLTIGVVSLPPESVEPLTRRI